MSEGNNHISESGIAGGCATVFVTNVTDSVQFYTRQLGMSLLYQAGEEFAMLDAGAGFLIGLHPPSENAGQPGTNGAIHIGLKVTRPIETVVEELQAAGVNFDIRQGMTSVVLDDGPVLLAFFTDPDGNPFYLFEYTDKAE